MIIVFQYLICKIKKIILKSGYFMEKIMDLMEFFRILPFLRIIFSQKRTFCAIFAICKLKKV